MNLPPNLRDLLDDFYKEHQIEKRDYPGIYVYWHGMGDDGGINEINLLTPAGFNYVKETTCNPAHENNNMQSSEYYLLESTPRKKWDGTDMYIVRNFAEFHRTDYSIDEWLYRTFDLCEVNDGSFANIYIDAQTGQVWGEAEHYVHETVPGVTIRYENRSAPSRTAESSNK